jgi:hypothetical protein
VSGNEKGNDDEDSSLYQLIRGVPSAIISRGGSQFCNDFIPSRTEQVKNEQEGNDTQFYVTLMTASSSDDTDTEEYSPKRNPSERITHLEDLIDRLEQQQKEKGAEPLIGGLIDQVNPKPNLTDRASSTEVKSTDNDLIDRTVKIRKSKKTKIKLILSQIRNWMFVSRNSKISCLRITKKGVHPI